MTTTALTRAVSRLLLGPVVMVALAILIKGYVDVGDGFAAGIIVALGVLLQYLAFGRTATERALPVHLAPRLAVAGLLVALAVVFMPVLLGGAPLEHAPAPGGEVVAVGSLELITAVLFDIGVFALVAGVSIALVSFLASAAAERAGP